MRGRSYVHGRKQSVFCRKSERQHEVIGVRSVMSDAKFLLRAFAAGVTTMPQAG